MNSALYPLFPADFAITHCIGIHVSFHVVSHTECVASPERPYLLLTIRSRVEITLWSSGCIPVVLVFLGWIPEWDWCALVPLDQCIACSTHLEGFWSFPLVQPSSPLVRSNVLMDYKYARGRRELPFLQPMVLGTVSSTPAAAHAAMAVVASNGKRVPRKWGTRKPWNKNLRPRRS